MCHRTAWAICVTCIVYHLIQLMSCKTSIIIWLMSIPWRVNEPWRSGVKEGLNISTSLFQFDQTSSDKDTLVLIWSSVTFLPPSVLTESMGIKMWDNQFPKAFINYSASSWKEISNPSKAVKQKSFSSIISTGSQCTLATWSALRMQDSSTSRGEIGNA